MIFCWEEEDRGRSSTYRELRGVEEGLKARGDSLRGHLVRWGCDNWAATKIIIMGSMREDCHQVAKRISQICQQLEIKLEPFWLRRNTVQITFCDSLSKDFDSSDYALSDADFSSLDRKFGPFSVDYFASSSTFQHRVEAARF